MHPVNTPIFLRRACIAATLTLLVIGLAWFAVRTIAELRPTPQLLGMDATFYIERTRSWLGGDGFYLPWQLAGPYTVEQGAAVYPPVAILLFLPFALGLPMVLWWAIPAGVLGLALYRLSPPVWTWPLLAALLFYPRTWVVIVLGNPSIWAIAGGVAGLAFGWPALAALLKPTFIPLALTGIRHRSWWLGLGALLVASLAFGSMWLDYAAVLLNGHSSRGIEYVLGEWPIALVLASVHALHEHRPIAKVHRGAGPVVLRGEHGGARG